jgi:hypothetical protein
MRALTLIVPLLLAASLAQAQSSTVYQWKDANGVTQYSERPPQGRQAESRRISHRGSVGEAVPAATREAPACTSARSNLALLQGSGPVGRDSDGDGVPDTALSTEERASARQQAEKDVANFCPVHG